LIFLLPSIQTRHIQANTLYDHRLGHVLNFCASQEVATKCASRSECGCSYQANCTTINALSHKEYFWFQFSMNSKDNQAKIEGTTDMNQPASCGIEYQVPVEQEIQNWTQKNNFSK
jgi:hypothetical protein